MIEMRDRKTGKQVTLTQTFSLGNAMAMTLKGFAQLLGFGCVGFALYKIFAGPVAPWVAAVEQIISK